MRHSDATWMLEARTSGGRPPASTLRTPVTNLRVNDAMFLARISWWRVRDSKRPSLQVAVIYSNLETRPLQEAAPSGTPRPPASTPSDPDLPPEASAPTPDEDSQDRGKEGLPPASTSA
jgi:hypothetical protein